MKLPSKIESTAIMLLTELERSIVNGYRPANKVILAMNDLKKAIDDEENLLTKELEELYNRMCKDNN